MDATGFHRCSFTFFTPLFLSLDTRRLRCFEFCSPDLNFSEAQLSEQYFEVALPIDSSFMSETRSPSDILFLSFDSITVSTSLPTDSLGDYLNFISTILDPL